jgi:6-phosphogluconolactonase
LVSRDIDELNAHTAHLFVSLAQQAVAKNRRFSVALAGGETPRRLYTLLPNARYATQISWEQVHVFWGDERHVPPDHRDSNTSATQQNCVPARARNPVRQAEERAGRHRPAPGD